MSDKRNVWDLFSAEGAKLIGGLLAIAIGVTAITAVALVAISLTTDTNIAPIATGAFGVIGSIVGAYYGVKVGTDTTKTALGTTQSSLDVARSAMAGQQAESAKAQAFAGHIDPARMPDALADAVRLASAAATVVRAGNVTRPAVTGAPRQGQPLEGAPGEWTGNPPPAYAYRWLRCDVAGANPAPIPGATAQTYTPTAEDVGSTLRLEVAATNPGGVTSATSPPTPVVAPPE